MWWDIPYWKTDSVHMGGVNAVFMDGHARGMKHAIFMQIRQNYTSRFRGNRSVYWHFWPYE